MKQIPLTSGGFAKVSDKDYKKANQFKWTVSKGWDIYPSTSMEWNGKRRTVRLHQLVMNQVKLPHGLEFDHKNHDVTDCRRSNLRIVDRFQQMWNCRKMRTKNKKTPTSRYKGVYYHKKLKQNPWVAKITCHYVHYFLGCHPTEIAAAKAYNEAANKFFGKYAWLNDV